MEPTKLLAGGLTLEESKAKRQEKQAARYRHRLGTYVPSGDSKGLLDALMATSSRKTPTPKPTSRRSIKVVDFGEKGTQAELSEKKPPMRSVGTVRRNTVEGADESASKPSASRQTTGTSNTAKPKATESSKKSATTKKRKPSRASSRNTDSDDRPIIPKPVQRKSKKSSAKPPPTQTDDDSDDLAIKKTKGSGKIDKGKARATESPPETFESAGTDADPEDSRPGPSNMKPLLAEEKALRDIPPEVYETTTTPVISRVAFTRGDTSDEEQKLKPPPKKRGRPRNDGGEGGPSSKRGKIQGASDGGDNEDPPKSKPKKPAKKPQQKPPPATTKGRTRKKADPPPDTSDEGEGGILSGSEPSGSATRKRRRRTHSDGSDDEERDEQDGDRSSSNPNRVRLDSIPPEGVVIRKKNGIVERLLPPAIKSKRKTSSNRGKKTRGSQKRAIPAHVLKYIGPTRFGSPLKADGTDTDDDLNL